MANLLTLPIDPLGQSDRFSEATVTVSPARVASGADQDAGSVDQGERLTFGEGTVVITASASEKFGITWL
jgi:hypothetical protein